MKIAIIGMGSIGRRHAQILHEKWPFHELTALRSSREPLNDPAIHEVYSWNDLAATKPDVAIIANPTSLHIEAALRCAEAGWRIFLEKPIGHSIEGLDNLVSYVQRHKIPTYVSYNLRFHPLIEKLKEYIACGTFLHMRAVCTSYLPEWRPGSDVKKSYSSNASQGGGVILDLSHEIDYTSYLLGSVESISGRYSRQSDITIDSEDCADMLLSCTRGPATVQVNFLSHIPQRIIQIDFKELSLCANLTTGDFLEYRNSACVNQEKVECPRDCTYSRQLDYFFANIDNCSMMNSIPDAAALFKKILSFKEKYTPNGK